MSAEAATATGRTSRRGPCARLQDRFRRRRGPHARRGARLGLSLLAGHACRSTLERRADPSASSRALAFVAVMVAACVFAVLVSQIFADSPLVLLLVVSLLIFPRVSAARPRPGGRCGGDVPHHHGRRAAARDRIRVRGSRVHLFADCRKRAGGPVDLCRTRAFPHASTGRAGFRPPARGTSPRRRRARKYRGADEPRDLFHATQSRRSASCGFDGHRHLAAAGRSRRRNRRLD